MTEPKSEPLSLERARLLLGWLRARRTLDNALSELLAAGPAGERRVSGEIGRITELVTASNEAFEAYRHSVLTSVSADHPNAPVIPLTR